MTDKLQNVFKNLRSKGKLTEDDVKSALKEVKIALLEADVNFKVVKQFIKTVQERAIGQDVMNGLNPGQMVIKIVNEEMICEEQKFYPMMRAVPREQAGVLAAPLTEKELRFGPFLIKERHPVLKEFLLSEGRTGRQIQEALAGQQGEGAVRRRQEVEEELRMIGEILELYKEPENICL